MATSLEESLAAVLSSRLGYAGPYPAEAIRFVQRRASATGTDPALWVRTVESRPADLRDLISAATVSHTGFYRHPEQIERFRQTLAGFAARSRPVKIWSAGCATGEEPWTLARVAADLGLDVDILATDISERAIEKAKTGWYLARETRALPGYDGKLPYRVEDALRARVRFHVGSLLAHADTDAGLFDVIFCRNVLIYFDPPSIDRAWRTFERKIQPWGAIVVSPVEALLRIPPTVRQSGPLGWFVRATAAPAERPEAPRPPTVAPPSQAPTSSDGLTFETVARLLRSDDTDGAERLLHAILARRDDALGWFLLGETCARRGELTQARIAYERAAKATEVAPEADLDTVRGAAIRRARQLGG